jgi:hypothetical protein
MTSTSNVAEKVNFKVIRGDSFTRDIVFWQDDAKTVPLDVTAFTFELVAKNCDGNTALKFNDDAGITRPDTQTLRLSKTAGEMNLPAGGYEYTFKRTSDVTVTLMYGVFEVTQL